MKVYINPAIQSVKHVQVMEMRLIIIVKLVFQAIVF